MTDTLALDSERKSYKDRLQTAIDEFKCRWKSFWTRFRKTRHNQKVRLTNHLITLRR
jgi:hypothetical protein